jgi:hypothetical protein
MAATAQISESNWHDPDSVAFMERARLRRYARKWRRDTELYVPEDRDLEEQRDRKYDRRHAKPKGRPELSAPKVFSEQGELSGFISRRISAQQQAAGEGMQECGLKSKANRVVCCGVFGRRVDCTENAEHRFYALFRCGLRYCPVGCGIRAFTKLFHKHMRLEQILHEVLGRAQSYRGSAVVAKLDFTCKKKGTMPSPEEVRKFNKDIRRFFRAFEKEFGISRAQYGCLWCDEFGSGNTNLHAHSLYVGPWVAQKKLSRIWQRVRGDGSFIVSIKVARSFELALAHCLKYPSKFFDAPGRRLADLEKAFHRVRRVHAVASFYNPKIEREPGEEGPLEGGCPECKAPLGESFSTKKGWDFFDVLQKEGRRELEAVRVSVAAARIFDPCPFLALDPVGASP